MHFSVRKIVKNGEEKAINNKRETDFLTFKSVSLTAVKAEYSLSR